MILTDLYRIKKIWAVKTFWPKNSDSNAGLQSLNWPVQLTDTPSQTDLAFGGLPSHILRYINFRHQKGNFFQLCVQSINSGSAISSKETSFEIKLTNSSIDKHD